MIFEILIYGLGLVSGVGLLFSILNKYNTPNPEKTKNILIQIVIIWLLVAIFVIIASAIWLSKCFIELALMIFYI